MFEDRNYLKKQIGFITSVSRRRRYLIMFEPQELGKAQSSSNMRMNQ